MNILSNIKQLFKKSLELNTDIASLNSLINIPKREFYKDNRSMISLIDKYKYEYINILNTKKYLTTNALTANNLQEQMKINIELLLNIISYYDIPNSKIDIYQKNLKIKIYLEDIKVLEIETKARLIALQEIISERAFLSKEKKHRINYEINNLTSLLMLFKSQIVAIEKEVDAYFTKLNTIDEDYKLSAEENEIIDKKIDDIFSLATNVIKDLDKSNYQGIIGLIALERQLETYAYNHKELAKLLKESVEIYSIFEPHQLLEKEDDIKLIESYYRIFNEYGRNIISDDDLYNLYKLKFKFLTRNIHDYDKQIITAKTTFKELESYKKIIMQMIHEISTNRNEVISSFFENNFIGLRYSKIINYMKLILKDGEEQFNPDKIIKDKFLFNILLCFCNPTELGAFFKNYKVDPFHDYIKTSDGEYTYLYLTTNYHFNIFQYDNELSLETIFQIDNINKAISKKDSSIKYMEQFKDKKYDRLRYLKMIYLHVGDSRYDFLLPPDGNSNDFILRDILPAFKFPEGIKRISDFAFPKDKKDILFWKEIIEKMQEKVVYLPNSLKMIDGSVFANAQIKGIVLNEGLLYLDMTAFSNLQLDSIIIPSSVKKIYVSNYFGGINNIIFNDFKNSKALNDNEKLSEFISFLIKIIPPNKKQLYFKFYFRFEKMQYIILMDENNEEIKIDLKEFESHPIFLSKNGITHLDELIGMTEDDIKIIIVERFKEEILKKTGYSLGESNQRTLKKMIN